MAENDARKASGQRPLYLMYDQVYWMLRVPGVEHVTPPGLVPEMVDYTIFVDGISKAFAATLYEVAAISGLAAKRAVFCDAAATAAVAIRRSETFARNFSTNFTTELLRHS